MIRAWRTGGRSPISSSSSVPPSARSSFPGGGLPASSRDRRRQHLFEDEAKVVPADSLLDDFGRAGAHDLDGDPDVDSTRQSDDRRLLRIAAEVAEQMAARNVGDVEVEQD